MKLAAVSITLINLLGPILAFYGLCVLARKSPRVGRRVNALAIALWAALFLGSLPISLVAHNFHLRAWLLEHPEGPKSEEDMLEMPDSSMLFVGWIFLGGIPPTIGLWLGPKLFRLRNRPRLQ